MDNPLEQMAKEIDDIVTHPENPSDDELQRISSLFYFVGRGGRKKLTGTWTPTIFENELLNLGIELINSRPYHPSDQRQA